MRCIFLPKITLQPRHFARRFVAMNLWQATPTLRHKGKHTWYCNKRYSKEKTCRTPIIHEEKLIALCLSALRRLLADKAAHVAEAQVKIKDLEDMSKIKVGQEKAQTRPARINR